MPNVFGNPVKVGQLLAHITSAHGNFGEGAPGLAFFTGTSLLCAPVSLRDTAWQMANTVIGDRKWGLLLYRVTKGKYQGLQAIGCSRASSEVGSLHRLLEEGLARDT